MVAKYVLLNLETSSYLADDYWDIEGLFSLPAETTRDYTQAQLFESREDCLQVLNNQAEKLLTIGSHWTVREFFNINQIDNDIHFNGNRSDS